MSMKQKTRRKILAFVASAFFVGQMPLHTVTASNTQHILEDISGNVMYGITYDHGQLYRYGVGDNQGQLEEIGLVQDKNGFTFKGIQASTILPGSHNIFAFWTDPADGAVKLLYVNPKDGRTMIVGDPVGFGTFTGATVGFIEGVDAIAEDGDGGGGDGDGDDVIIIDTGDDDDGGEDDDDGGEDDDDGGEDGLVTAPTPFGNGNGNQGNGNGNPREW